MRTMAKLMETRAKVPRSRGRNVRRAMGLLGGTALLLCLAGCPTRPQSAMELMQQERQQQALVNGQQDAAQKAQLPDSKDLALSAISAMQQQGRYFAALAYIAQFHQQFGESVDADVLEAEALRQTGQASRAKVAYQKLISENRAAVGWHGLGLLSGEAGDFATAADDIARATVLEPTNGVYLSDLGYALLREGDLAGARVPMGQAAELAPDDQTVLGNLALLLLLDDQPDQAQSLMVRANLSDQAQAQVRTLAAQTQPAVQAWQLRQQASAQKQAAATELARANTEDALAVGNATSTNVTKAAGTSTVPAPMLQTVMDRFGQGAPSQ